MTIIVAHDAQRGIGKGNTLPWHLPADLKRFKAVTTGHPIVMGRKTYESIGRPLPDRANIIVTRNESFTAEGCVVTHSLEDALARAREVDADEAFIIGGAEIYALALPMADRLLITEVSGTHEADAFFPEYAGFTETEREPHEDDGASYAFVTLDRQSAPA